MGQHQPPVAHSAATQHITFWEPCRLLQVPCHGTCPTKCLLWAHHALWSNDGFGDPFFTQIQHPGLRWHHGWVGTDCGQGAMNPVWAEL